MIQINKTENDTDIDVILELFPWLRKSARRLI